MELRFETYERLPPVATGDPPVVTGGLRWVSSTGYPFKIINVAGLFLPWLFCQLSLKLNGRKKNMLLKFSIFFLYIASCMRSRKMKMTNSWVPFSRKMTRDNHEKNCFPRTNYQLQDLLIQRLDIYASARKV